MLNQYPVMSDFYDRLGKIHRATEDHLVPSRQLLLNVDFAGDAPKQLLTIQGINSYEMTENTHRSLGSLAGVPRDYYKHLQKHNQLELLKLNVNTLLRQVEPESMRMVRTLKPIDNEPYIARNILSDAYHRIDNYDVLDLILRVLGEDFRKQEIEIRSTALTDDHMHIKLVKPSLQRVVKAGDIIELGVSVRNSDVGKSAFEIIPFIYRRVCNNGMNAYDQMGYKRRHVTSRSSNHESFMSEDKISQETKILQDKAMLSEIGDVLKELMSGDFADKILAYHQKALGVEVTRPDKVIKTLGQTYMFSEALADDILASFLKAGDNSQYGLAQAVTEAAHTSENVNGYDHAHELESIGWGVMNLDLSKIKIEG